jgi:hypothetical protein
MFAKTFDTIYENAIQEYLLRRAKLLIEWRRVPKRPPPLNVLVDVYRESKWLLLKSFSLIFGKGDEEQGHPGGAYDFDSIVPRTERGEWIRRVLKDFEENGDFKSESQMDKFKGTMLKFKDATETKMESLEEKMESLGKKMEAQLAMLAVQQALLQQLVNRSNAANPDEGGLKGVEEIEYVGSQTAK